MLTEPLYQRSRRVGGCGYGWVGVCVCVCGKAVIEGFSVHFCHPEAPQKLSELLSLGSRVPFCYPCHTCNVIHPSSTGFHPLPSLRFHSLIHNYSLLCPPFSTSLTLIPGPKVPPLCAAVKELQGTHIWTLLNLCCFHCLIFLFGMA